MAILLLRHYHWSLVRRYIGTISNYNLIRLYTMNIKRSKELKLTDIKKKSRSKWYPAQTITDSDYADDQALLANTSAQADSLLYSPNKL